MERDERVPCEAGRSATTAKGSGLDRVISVNARPEVVNKAQNTSMQAQKVGGFIGTPSQGSFEIIDGLIPLL